MIIIKKGAQFFICVILALSCMESAAFPEADPRDSYSPFGILSFVTFNHEWNDYYYASEKDIEHEADLIKEAGAGFIRMDFLWYDLEPEPGVFDFKKYDNIVNIFRKRNISVLGILHYNPRWDNEPWNKPPNPEFYKRYASAVVGHFKDRVKYWEIWNEPDEETYWQPQDDMKTYTLLLKKVYPAIKRADPTCKVIMGGVSKTIAISLNKLYKNGAKDYFDIINIHPFADPFYNNGIETVRGIYKGVRSIMEKYGDSNKKIWLTEIGCPGVVKNTRDNGWWQGKSPTESQQAQWVEVIYKNCLKWENVEKVFWAFFRDTDCFFKSGVDNFGLVRCDFSKKPAYYAYQKAALCYKDEK